MPTSPPADSGVQAALDYHDVLIIQLAGEKSWEVRGLSRGGPPSHTATIGAVAAAGSVHSMSHV